MKRFLCLVAAAATLAGLLPPATMAMDCYVDPVQQYSGTGTIRSGVYLRSEACVTGTMILKTLSANTVVSVVGYTDGWYEVVAGGKRGWIGQQFLNSAAQATGVIWPSYEEYRSNNPASLPSADPGPSPATESLYTGSIGPRDLLKLACTSASKSDDPCRAVYYVGGDGKRHAFPNSETFFSWYAGFDNVRVVTQSQLGQYALGANITFRPGKLMVKFTTDPKTYAVARGGVLRWVKTEELARTYYGPSWNQNIRDIADTFYTNYTFGADISSSGDYDPAAELAGAATFD